MSLIDDRRHWRYRLYEMLPGTLVWGTFVLAILLSFWRPLWVIYFIIIFSLLWVFRVIYFVFYISLAWRRYRRDTRRDWRAEALSMPGHERVRHLIFLPTYNESLEVLRTTFRSLCESTYPTNSFIVVLAGEARGGEAAFRDRAARIKAEFGDRFADMIITVHPADLPDELPGKGSNLNYAGHQVKKLLAVDKFADPDYLIVSSFDIDTCAHPQYFACLTATFLQTPDRHQASYQPVALYNNNMWESHPLLRVAAFGTTFWLMSELMRPERLFTFSSHSMSWRMLVDVDFWEKDIVTEDSRIFLQGFLRYDGNYRVVPIFVPVSMNTVADDNWWKSWRSLYKQQRRWAWGAEHLPYMSWHFRAKRRAGSISLSQRARYLWNLSEGMYSWATTPILLFVLGRLPLLVMDTQVKATLIAQNAPFILERLMWISMAGMIVSAGLALRLIPPRPSHLPHHHYILMLLQWLLLPVTFVIFGSLPAIDAQTRLLLGGKWRLGFWVSPKRS